MFALDRVWDTPGWPRLALFAAGGRSACAAVPLALHRWVWRNRRLDQLARLLGRKHPHVGDQLLGRDRAGPRATRSRPGRGRSARRRSSRSPTTPAGATSATPCRTPGTGSGPACWPSRRRSRSGLFAARPRRRSNAWARLLAPWKRHAAVHLRRRRAAARAGWSSPTASRSRSTVTLADGTAWQPEQGRGPARRPAAGRRPAPRRPVRVRAARRRSPPAGSRSASATRPRRVEVEPTLRPELTSVVADVTLPDYLGRPGLAAQGRPRRRVSLVKGSRAAFAATASRELAVGQGRRPAADARRRRPSTSPTVQVDGPRDGRVPLAGRASAWPARSRSPSTVTGRDDEAPTLACRGPAPPEGRARHRAAQLQGPRPSDDFGVKRVGLEWQGLDDPVGQDRRRRASASSRPAGTDKEALEVAGTFSAKSLGIEPQPVDAPGLRRGLPPRPPPGLLAAVHLLRPQRRAARHLAHRAVEQVAPPVARSPRPRDAAPRDQQAAPRPCRPRSSTGPRPADEDREPGRGRAGQRPAALGPGRARARTWSSRRCGTPSSASATWRSGPRCSRSSRTSRANRMPSVADLLKQAAQAPSRRRRARRATRRPMAGQVRAGAGRQAADRARRRTPSRRRPSRRSSTASRRSSSPDKKPSKPPAPSKAPKPPRLTPAADDPGRQGRARRARRPPRPRPEGRRGGQAAARPARRVREDRRRAEPGPRQPGGEHAGQAAQGRLAGRSTKIAGRLGDQVGDTFGVPDVARSPTRPRSVLDELAEQEAKGSQDVSVIMDDMQAYFERRQFVQFKTVLDEMRKHDVVGSLRQLGDDLKKEHGRLDRPVRVLVGHARPLGRGPRRPGLQAAPAPAASRRAACRRRSSWKSSRSSKPRSTSARRPASPSRPGPPWPPRSTASRPASSPTTQDGPARTASRRSPSGSATCPTREAEFAYEIDLLGQVADGHGRGDRDPRPARDRQPGHRRRDRGDRAAAQVQADQPQGRRRRRLRRPAAAARGTTQRLGPGPARQRPEREGSPRGPRRLAGDRRLRPVPPRGVPRRARRVLQPARTRPRPVNDRAIARSRPIGRTPHEHRPRRPSARSAVAVAGVASALAGLGRRRPRTPTAQAAAPTARPRPKATTVEVERRRPRSRRRPRPTARRPSAAEGRGPEPARAGGRRQARGPRRRRSSSGPSTVRPIDPAVHPAVPADPPGGIPASSSTVCEPTQDQRREIAREGRAGAQGRGDRSSPSGRSSTVVAERRWPGGSGQPDPRKIIQDALAAAVKAHLSPEQVARYQRGGRRADGRPEAGRRPQPRGEARPGPGPLRRPAREDRRVAARRTGTTAWCPSLQNLSSTYEPLLPQHPRPATSSPPERRRRRRSGRRPPKITSASSWFGFVNGDGRTTPRWKTPSSDERRAKPAADGAGGAGRSSRRRPDVRSDRHGRPPDPRRGSPLGAWSPAARGRRRPGQDDDDDEPTTRPSPQPSSSAVHGRRANFDQWVFGNGRDGRRGPRPARLAPDARRSTRSTGPAA